MLQRVLFIALLSIFGFSCANSQNTETKKSEKSETKGLVMKMDQKLFLEKIFDYKKQNQEWKYESDKPSIIDFYADWCAPCRKVAPILDELAEEYKGKI
ncbi:MAG: thioredoxin family protein, partial [Bacteroidales bacterium]